MADLAKNVPQVRAGTTISAPSALTSAASVGVPTKVEFDKTVADLVALRATLLAYYTALTS